jgi:GNAT superfamily N-acetyltransferase
MSARLSAPEPLCADHDLSAFACGEASLDDWLKRRALANQLSGASRTFVVLDENRFAVGYYALAAGAVAHERATGGIRRNMPDPIPVLVLGRLAVAQRAQGVKLGAALLQDAVLRAMAVSENAGVRALLVHALNESARAFYAHYGFQESPLDPLTLMLRLHGPTAAV